jgi:tetratricopeptide (TPR) repeat protein
VDWDSDGPTIESLPAEHWRRALADDPERAVGDVLEGVFPFSRPVREPVELLYAWLGPSGQQRDAAPLADAGLAAWIEARWQQLGAETESEVEIAADVWSTAFRCVSSLPTVFPGTARVLRTHFEQRRDLAHLSVGESRDPVAEYLRALARSQEDASLVDEWWSLCDLRERQPYYRAEIGVVGLRFAPGLDEVEGGFKAPIVAGLLRVGASWDSLEQTGVLSESTGRRRFVHLARRLQAQYPFPERWVEYALRARSDSSLPTEWLREAVPLLRHTPLPTKEAGKDAAQAVSHERARAMATLREDNSSATLDAFLGTERTEAMRRGDILPLVISLCTLAQRFMRRDPDYAWRLASEARAWDPDDHYTWTVSTNALLQRDGPFAALPLAWEASERFPWESAVHNQLAHVLTRGRQLDLAEAIYRWSAARFPTDPHSLGGLAEIAKHRHDLESAAEQYGSALSLFGDNNALKLGLAAVFRLRGPEFWDEAERVLGGIEISGKDAQRLAKEKQRLALARTRGVAPTKRVDDEVDENEAQAWKPDPLTAIRAARSLRATASFGSGGGGLSVASEYLDSASTVPLRGADAARLECEQTLVLLAKGRTTDALPLSEHSTRRFPGVPATVYALARARRQHRAAESARFSDDALRELVEPWRRIGTLASLPDGLRLLGETRAAAALSDGHVVDGVVLKSTRLLSQWARHVPHTQDSWGARSFVKRLDSSELLGAAQGSAAEIRQVLNQNEAILDDAEEALIFSLG